jgi:hypothetical protein
MQPRSRPDAASGCATADKMADRTKRGKPPTLPRPIEGVSPFAQCCYQILGSTHESDSHVEWFKRHAATRLITAPSPLRTHSTGYSLDRRYISADGDQIVAVQLRDDRYHHLRPFPFS